jgi:nucleoside-diphosphate-sugar epimerase
VPFALPNEGAKMSATEHTSTERPVVLVTGSSGLIGSRLIEVLAESGRYAIFGLDVQPPREQTASAKWVKTDMTDDASVRAALGEVRNEFGKRIATVVHLAAYYNFTGEESPLYETLTVQGTRRLLEGLQQFDVEQFIFSSTLLVMEPAEEGEVLTEQSPVAPAWDYPKSKIRAEAVIRQHRGSIPALILRMAGVYDEDGHSIPIGQQIARIHQKQLESYLFPGDTDHGQAFVHLDDLIDCIELAIERRHQMPEYETLLIAEPDVMSYEELQDAIGELLYEREWPTIRIPKAVAKAGAWVKGQFSDEAFIKPWMIDLADQHYPVEISRARKVLGWEPKHRLRTTLPEIIRRLQADPAGWYKRNNLEPPEDT